MVDDLRVPDDLEDATTAGGVYAIMNDKVRLFTLGSVSRGIPYKQWTIPLPDIVPENYGFYPDADVIAFVELLRLMCVCIRPSKPSLRAHSDVPQRCGDRHLSEDFV